MDAKTLKRLEKAGWSHGDYGDFLGMTPEEKEIVEMRIAATKEISWSSSSSSTKTPLWTANVPDRKETDPEPDRTRKTEYVSQQSS